VSEEILINVAPSETRVALVDGGMLQEVWLERTGHDGCIGNIFKGQVSRVLPGLQAAFVDIGLERSAFLHAADMMRTDSAPENSSSTGPAIAGLLSTGQHIMVQVLKDPLGSKGARLTTNISIPSRFLVLLPNARTVGVSARIEDEQERNRLKQAVLALRDESSSDGYIVRTNAEGVNEFALSADMTYLDKVWKSILERAERAEAGTRIYEELSLPLRALRDLMHDHVEKVRIDAPDIVAIAQQFARGFVPDLLDRIEAYKEERPIFDLFGVEDEIEAALQRQVPLKSGGYVIFDQTEAMTTIDVNSGGFVTSRNFEDTIYKTNLEATQAIARQLRLRNLGGIIIIDFIDMDDEEHRRQVMRSLRRALARDNVTVNVSDLSSLGLVEMTRKRISESLEHRMCVTCRVCSGRGSVKSTSTVCMEVFREIMRSGRQFEAEMLMVTAAPPVVQQILDEHSGTVAELEELIGKSIRFRTEEQFFQEQFDVVLL
jgi:ribonuclease G